MNNVTLVGRITKDIEVKVFKDTAVAKFTWQLTEGW